jgi:NTP pyrophosphatase (non-canonical NTP hydrolase)
MKQNQTPTQLFFNKKDLTLNEIQTLVYKEYIDNGYLNMWLDSQSLKGLITKRQYINDIAELGLITTEVSEAIESIRLNKNNLGEECSDIIIRVLNFMSRKGLNAQKEIIQKNMVNVNRTKLHGKEV